MDLSPVLEGEGGKQGNARNQLIPRDAGLLAAHPMNSETSPRASDIGMTDCSSPLQQPILPGQLEPHWSIPGNPGTSCFPLTGQVPPTL